MSFDDDFSRRSSKRARDDDEISHDGSVSIIGLSTLQKDSYGRRLASSFGDNGPYANSTAEDVMRTIKEKPTPDWAMLLVTKSKEKLSKLKEKSKRDRDSVQLLWKEKTEEKGNLDAELALLEGAHDKLLIEKQRIDDAVARSSVEIDEVKLRRTQVIEEIKFYAKEERIVETLVLFIDYVLNTPDASKVFGRSNLAAVRDIVGVSSPVPPAQSLESNLTIFLV